MKKVNWIENAYKSTDVYWGKSQAKIMTMLGEIGIDQIRFTSTPDRFILEFMAQIDERAIPKAVRIITPIRAKKDDIEVRNKELNIIHRIMFNHLKAKFVAIGKGLTEFEQEFMAHLVITDKSGRETTMAEALLPQYEKNLLDKTIPKFNLLGDGK